jgi:3-hydroxyacyl-CoA dehydrogenase
MFCKLQSKIDLSEKNIKVLLLETKQFSVGANIGMIFMMAVEQEYDIEHGNQNISGYNDACALFINSCSSCSRNDFWWCEMSLHADKVVAAAETHMGLVEFGVELYQVVVALKRWR